MPPHEIEQIATAVGRAVADAFAAAVIPAMQETRGAVDALRSDVFKSMNDRVSRDECQRTHAALPPVTILMAIGGSAAISSIVTGIAVYAITH